MNEREVEAEEAKMLEDLREIERSIHTIQEEQESIRADMKSVDMLLDNAEREQSALNAIPYLESPHRKRLSWFWVVGSTGLLFVAAQFLYRGAGSRLDTFYAWVAKHDFLGLLGLMVVAQLAYTLRKHRRRIYGAVEFGIATASAGVLLTDPRPGLLQTASLVTAIYFMVRGQDNLTSGVEEDLKTLKERREAWEKRRAELSLAIVDLRRRVNAGDSRRSEWARKATDLRAHFEDVKKKYRLERP